MQPDGFIEIIEEGAISCNYVIVTPLMRTADIIFPALPRWFTDPLRANDPSSGSRSNSSESSSPESSSPLLTPVEKDPHEHAILEFLFNSVFESRFINMKPTGSLSDLKVEKSTR